MNMPLPYSRKVWQVESLANLANRLQFAKLKPSKLVVTIDNPLADLFISQTFSTKCLKTVNLPNILPAKLSHYTVYAFACKIAITFVFIILAEDVPLGDYTLPLSKAEVVEEGMDI